MMIQPYFNAKAGSDSDEANRVITRVYKKLSKQFKLKQLDENVTNFIKTNDVEEGGNRNNREELSQPGRASQSPLAKSDALVRCAVCVTVACFLVGHRLQ